MGEKNSVSRSDIVKQALDVALMSQSAHLTV